jgi:hypothetical protein
MIRLNLTLLPHTTKSMALLRSFYNEQTLRPGWQALVAQWRVWVWPLLNFAFTLSGVGFMIIQAKSLEPLVAALLLDSGAVPHQNDGSLCVFSSVRKGDTRLGYLRLRRNLGHRKLDFWKGTSGHNLRGSLSHRGTMLSLTIVYCGFHLLQLL